MVELFNRNPSGITTEVATEETKKWILSQLATTFSDDVEFLRKVNKLTFGLQSNQ